MKNIVLKTKNSNISFYITSTGEGYVYFKVSISSSDPALFVENDESFPMSRGDVERLSLYFDKHIQALIDGSSSESYKFVPQELFFSLQALDGDIDSLDDGCFTIVFMLRVGEVGYWGVESVVDLEDLTVFTNSLRAAYP